MKEREAWVDNIKIFACFLVLLGHFFQGMTEANIIPVTNVYDWFIKNIYLFHVQLFFICSGYLYQRGCPIDSFKVWKSNVLKKLLMLGIPYVTFSVLTWMLKIVFSLNVNNLAEGLFTTLFIHPINQYWYFYILFVLFVITPTLNNNRIAISVTAVSVILKVMNIMRVFGDIYILKRISESLIWFVFGMLIGKYLNNRMKNYRFGMLLIAVFLTGFTIAYRLDFLTKLNEFILGLIACTSFIILFRGAEFLGKGTKVAEYTMPVFLMHTIMAAALRSVLLKLGITSFAVHAVLGISISILGPIVMYEIMKRNKFLMFFITPRVIRLSHNN